MALFQRPIVNALTAALSEYFDGINHESLGLSLWGGTLSLRNLRIRRDVLLKLGVPLAITSSQIDTVSVTIPWNALHTQPVVAKLNTVGLRCALSPTTDGNRDDAMSLEEKQRRLAEIDAELAAAEEALLLSEGSTGGSSTGVVGRLRVSILRNLVVEAEHIRVAVDVPPMVAGDPPSILTLTIDKLNLSSANKTWEPVVAGSGTFEDFRKRLFVQGIALALAVGDDPRRTLIKPFNVEARVHCFPTKTEPDTNDVKLKATADVSIDEVNTALDYQQACSLAMLILFFEQRVNIMRFHRFRPTSPVVGNGRAWFQYCGRCVLQLVRTAKKRGLVESGREKLERDYVHMHKHRIIRQPGRETGWMDALPRVADYQQPYNERYHALLERTLPILNLAELRRRANTELKDEYENEVPLETRLLLQQRARAEVQAKNNAGLWGRTKRITSAVWGFWGSSRGNAAADDSDGDSVASDSSRPSTPPLTSPDQPQADGAPLMTTAAALATADSIAAEKPAIPPGSRHMPIIANVKFGGLVLALKRTDAVPVGTFTLGSATAAATFVKGTFDGPVSLKLGVNAVAFMDEVNKAARCPVLQSTPKSKLLSLQAERTSDGSIKGAAEVSPWTIVIRRACLVEIIKMASMPSALFNETLETAVNRLVECETVEESLGKHFHSPHGGGGGNGARSKVAGLLHQPSHKHGLNGSATIAVKQHSLAPVDSPARLRAASEREAKKKRETDKRQAAAKKTSAALNFTVRLGAPTIILPAEADALRGTAVIVTLGQLTANLQQAKRRKIHVKATLSNVGVTTAQVLKGEVARTLDTVIEPVSGSVDYMDGSHAHLSISDFRTCITPTNLAVLARVSGSLRAIAESLVTLGEGVSFIGCCVSDPVFTEGDDEFLSLSSTSDDDDGDGSGMRWRPCELLVKTEGVGARTIIQITEAIDLARERDEGAKQQQDGEDAPKGKGAKSNRDNKQQGAASLKKEKDQVKFQRIVVVATEKTVAKEHPLLDDPLQIVVSVPQSDGRQLVLPIKCPDKKARDTLLRRINESVGTRAAAAAAMAAKKQRELAAQMDHSGGDPMATVATIGSLAGHGKKAAAMEYSVKLHVVALSLRGRGHDERLEVELLPISAKLRGGLEPITEITSEGLRVVSHSSTEPLLVLGAPHDALTVRREVLSLLAEQDAVSVKAKVPALQLALDHTTAPDVARFGLYMGHLVVDEHLKALEQHGAKEIVNVLFTEFTQSAINAAAIGRHQRSRSAIGHQGPNRSPPLFATNSPPLSANGGRAELLAPTLALSQESSVGGTVNRVEVSVEAAGIVAKLIAKPAHSNHPRYDALTISLSGISGTLRASDFDGIHGEGQIERFCVNEGVANRNIVETRGSLPLVKACVDSIQSERKASVRVGDLAVNFEPDHVEFVSFLNLQYYMAPFTADKASAVHHKSTVGAAAPATAAAAAAASGSLVPRGSLTAAQRAADDVAAANRRATSGGAAAAPTFALAADIVARQNQQRLQSRSADFSVVQITSADITIERIGLTTIRERRDCFAAYISSVACSVSLDEPAMGDTRYAIVVRDATIAAEMPWHSDPESRKCTTIQVTSAAINSLGSIAAVTDVTAVVAGDVSIHASHVVTMAASYSHVVKTTEHIRTTIGDVTLASGAASAVGGSNRSPSHANLTSLARRAHRTHSRVASSGDFTRRNTRGSSGNSDTLGMTRNQRGDRHASFALSDTFRVRPESTGKHLGAAGSSSATTATAAVAAPRPSPALDVTLSRLYVAIGTSTDLVVALGIQDLRVRRRTMQAVPQTTLSLRCLVLASGVASGTDVCLLTTKDRATVLCLRTPTRTEPTTIVTAREEVNPPRTIVDATFPMESLLSIEVDVVARRALLWAATVATDPSVVALVASQKEAAKARTTTESHEPTADHVGKSSETRAHSTSDEAAASASTSMPYLSASPGAGAGGAGSSRQASMDATPRRGRTLSHIVTLHGATVATEHVTSATHPPAATSAAAATAAGLHLSIAGPFIPVRIVCGAVPVQLNLGNDVVLGTQQIAVTDASVTVAGDALLSNVSVRVTRSHKTTVLVRSISSSVSPAILQALSSFADALEDVQDCDWRGGLGPNQRTYVRLEAECALAIKDAASLSDDDSDAGGACSPMMVQNPGPAKRMECVARIFGVPGGAPKVKLTLGSGCATFAMDDGFVVDQHLMSNTTSPQLAPQSPLTVAGDSLTSPLQMDAGPASSQDPPIRGAGEVVILMNKATGQSVRLVGADVIPFSVALEAFIGRHREKLRNEPFGQKEIVIPTRTASPNPISPGRSLNESASQPRVPPLSIDTTAGAGDEAPEGSAQLQVMLAKATVTLSGFPDRSFCLKAAIEDIGVEHCPHRTTATLKAITLETNAAPELLALTDIRADFVSTPKAGRRIASQRLILDTHARSQLCATLSTKDVKAIRLAAAHLMANAPKRIAIAAPLRPSPSTAALPSPQQPAPHTYLEGGFGPISLLLKSSEGHVWGAHIARIAVDTTFDAGMEHVDIPKIALSLDDTPFLTVQHVDFTVSLDLSTAVASIEGVSLRTDIALLKRVAEVQKDLVIDSQELLGASFSGTQRPARPISPNHAITQRAPDEDLLMGTPTMRHRAPLPTGAGDGAVPAVTPDRRADVSVARLFVAFEQVEIALNALKVSASQSGEGQKACIMFDSTAVSLEHGGDRGAADLVHIVRLEVDLEAETEAAPAAVPYIPSADSDPFNNSDDTLNTTFTSAASPPAQRNVYVAVRLGSLGGSLDMQQDIAHVTTLMEGAKTALGISASTTDGRSPANDSMPSGPHAGAAGGFTPRQGVATPEVFPDESEIAPIKRIDTVKASWVIGGARYAVTSLVGADCAPITLDVWRTEGIVTAVLHDGAMQRVTAANLWTVNVSLKHHNHVAFRFEASQLLDYRREADDAPIQIAANLGQLTIDLPQAVMDTVMLLRSKYLSPKRRRRRQFPKPGGKHHTVASAATEGRSRASTAGDGGLHLPRAHINIIGPQLSLAFLSELMCAVTVTQCFVESTGDISTSRVSGGLVVEVHPIVATSSMTDGDGRSSTSGPQTWTEAKTVSPALWLDATMALQAGLATLEIATLGLDSSQIPMPLKKTAAAYAPRAAVELLLRDDCSQHCLVDKLAAQLKFSHETAAQAAARNAGANSAGATTTGHRGPIADVTATLTNVAASVGSVSLLFSSTGPMVMGLPSATVHANIRGIDMALGLDTARLRVDFCDLGVVPLDFVYLPYAPAESESVDQRLLDRAAWIMDLFAEEEAQLRALDDDRRSTASGGTAAPPARTAGSRRTRAPGSAASTIKAPAVRFDVQELWRLARETATVDVEVSRVQVLFDATKVAWNRKSNPLVCIIGAHNITSVGTSLSAPLGAAADRGSSIVVQRVSVAAGIRTVTAALPCPEHFSDSCVPDWGAQVAATATHDEARYCTVDVDALSWRLVDGSARVKSVAGVIDAATVTNALWLGAEVKCWQQHTHVWRYHPAIKGLTGATKWRRIRTKLGILLHHRPFTPSSAEKARENLAAFATNLVTAASTLNQTLSMSPPASLSLDDAAAMEVEAFLGRLSVYDRTYLGHVAQKALADAVAAALAKHFDERRRALLNEAATRAAAIAAVRLSISATSAAAPAAVPRADRREPRRVLERERTLHPASDELVDAAQSNEQPAVPLSLSSLTIERAYVQCVKDVTRRNASNPELPEYYLDLRVDEVSVGASKQGGSFGSRISVASLAVDDFLSATQHTRVVRLVPIEAESPLYATGSFATALNPNTALLVVMENGQTLVYVASCTAIASASLQRSLGRLVTVSEGFTAISLPPRTQVAEAERQKAKQTPPMLDREAWIARTMHVHLTCPQTYHQDMTRGLEIAFNDGCFYPEMLPRDEHVKYSSTMCKFGSLRMDVVWLNKGQLDRDFEAQNFAPMLEADQGLTFSMKNSRDYDNYDWIWQQPYANAPNGRVEVNLTTRLYMDFNLTLCAVMRHWAYDKYSVDEPRYFEHQVEVMGPWMVTSDEGRKTCESKYFVPFTVSHPKVLHWTWYNCLRFDAAEGELCPFYMHMNPLSHLVDVSEDLLPARLLPAGVDRQLLLAYIVPQDGRSVGATANYYVAFIKCASLPEKARVFANISSALAKEKLKPTLYANTKDPRNTWSSQRYAMKDMTIHFREERSQRDPVSSIHIPNFVYTQVNRQHDWEINVFCDRIDVFGRNPPPLPPGVEASPNTELAAARFGTATDVLVARIVPPPAESLVTYNIIHTKRSPLALDGLPLWGGTVRVAHMDLHLAKGPTLLAVKKFYSRMGVEFGDAHSLMWQLTLLERGGNQQPFDPECSLPWKVVVKRLTATLYDGPMSRSLLEAEVCNVLFETTFKSKRAKTTRVAVGSIDVNAEGIDIVTTSPATASRSRRPFRVRRSGTAEEHGNKVDHRDATDPPGPLPSGPASSRGYLELYMASDLAYQTWSPTDVNVSQRIELSAGTLCFRAPWPRTVRRLQRWGAFPPVEPSDGLFERVTRMSGNREGRRAVEAEEARRTQYTKNCAACILAAVSVSQLTATLPEGRRFEGDASVEVDVSDIGVDIALEPSASRPAVRLNGGVRHIAIATHKSGDVTSLLKPFGVRATLTQTYTASTDSYALCCPGGWSGDIAITPIVVTLDATQYAIIMNALATYTAKPKSSKKSAAAATPVPAQRSTTLPPSPPSGPNHVFLQTKILFDGLDITVYERAGGAGIMQITLDAFTSDFIQRLRGDLNVRTPQLRLEATEIAPTGARTVVLAYGRRPGGSSSAKDDGDSAASAQAPLGSSVSPQASDSDVDLNATAAPRVNGVARASRKRLDFSRSLSDPLLVMVTKPDERTSVTNVQLAPLALLATPPLVTRLIAFTSTKRAKTVPKVARKKDAAVKRRIAYEEHFNSTVTGSATAADDETAGSAPLGRTRRQPRVATSTATEDLLTDQTHTDGADLTSYARSTDSEMSGEDEPTTDKAICAAEGTGVNDDSAAEAIGSTMKEGDTVITSEVFELKGDLFLSTKRRLLFHRPGCTIRVNGNYHTMYLGHFGAPAHGSSAPTPDIVHWNIVVGPDTIVELHDITVNVDDAWHGLIHMAHRGRFVAQRANGAFLEIVRPEAHDDDDVSDLSDMSDLGSNVQLGEFDNEVIDDGLSNPEDSEYFANRSIDESESVMSVARFISAPKDHRTNITVERLLLGVCAPDRSLGVASPLSMRATQGSAGDIVFALQLGFVAEYNTQNEPSPALGFQMRTVNSECRALPVVEFINAAVRRESVAGLGAPVLAPLNLRAEAFGDKSHGKDRYYAQAAITAIGIHLSSRRLQALMAISNGFTAALKKNEDSVPQAPPPPPPSVQSSKSASQSNPLEAPKEPQASTKQVIRFELEAGGVTIHWYGFDKTRKAMNVQQLASSPRGLAQVMRTMDSGVNQMLNEPPIVKFALDAIQLSGKLHLPSATYITSGQLLLSADVFNEATHVYEPLIEEAGFGISARKVQVTATKFSTVVAFVGVNTLDVTVANTYITRLQNAYAAAMEALAPKPDATPETPELGRSARALDSFAAPVPAQSQPDTPAVSGNSEWGSFSLVLSGTSIRNRLGIPLTIICGNQRHVIPADAPDLMIDDVGQTNFYARVGCRDEDERAGGGVTDCFGPLMAVSLRDTRRQYLPFRTAAAHAARKTAGDADEYADGQVRFAVLSVFPERGRNVAQFASPLTFVNFTAEELVLVRFNKTNSVRTRIDPDCDPISTPTELLDTEWYLEIPSRSLRSAKRPSMTVVAKKESKTFAVAFYDNESDAATADGKVGKKHAENPASFYLMITITVSYVPNRDLVAERIVSFDAPLVLHNLLPFPCEVLLTTDANGDGVKHESRMGASQRDALYCGHLEGALFLGVLIDSPQGRLLHPYRMLELEDGEKELRFVDGRTDDSFRLTVDVTRHDATVVISFFSPYLLVNGFPHEHAYFHLDDNFAPGTPLPRWASLPYQFGERLSDVPTYARHPLTRCAVCNRRLIPSEQKKESIHLSQCGRTGRLAHESCVPAAPHDCWAHLTAPIQSSPRRPGASSFAAAVRDEERPWTHSDGILVFTPPSFDPFGGKLRVSVNASESSQPFSYDAVNVDGAVMCRDVSDDSHDEITVRTVGISLRLGPFQYVKSKLVIAAPFMEIANTTPDITVRLMVYEADTPIATLGPQQRNFVDFVAPRRFLSDKKLVKDNKWPRVYLQVLRTNTFGEESVVAVTPPFDITALGDVSLKTRPFIETASRSQHPSRDHSLNQSKLVPYITPSGEPPELVLCVSTTIQGPTMRVRVLRDTTPPIRIVNHTWTAVEFQQASDLKTFTRPSRVEAMQVTPYYFDDANNKKVLILRLVDTGFTVRIKPMSVESSGASEEFDVLSGEARNHRVSILVGYDAIVVAIEEHHAIHNLAVHVDVRTVVELARPATSDVTLRVAFKYGGQTKATSHVKVLKGQKTITFPPAPALGLEFPVHSRRDAISVSLEEETLLVWSSLGVTFFEISGQDTNRGTATIDFEPPVNVEDPKSVGTVTFSWIGNTSLPPELDIVSPTAVRRNGGTDLVAERYSLYVDVEVSLGVSLIHRSASDGTATEEGYFYIGGLQAMVSTKHGGEMDIEVLMGKMQMDNQRGSAIFPVIFSTPEQKKLEASANAAGEPVSPGPPPATKDPVPAPADAAVAVQVERQPLDNLTSDKSDAPSSVNNKPQSAALSVHKDSLCTVGSVRSFTALQKITRRRAREHKGKVARFLHVSIARLTNGACIVKTAYSGICMQEMTVTVDDLFIEHLLDVFPKSYFEATTNDFPNAVATVGCLDAHTAIEDTTHGERKFYCQALQLHPILLYLTFLSASENQDGALVILRTVGMAIQSVDRATIKVNALLLDQPFGRISEVVGIIRMHFVRQAIMEAYKVLGALDFIGNPVTLLSNIADGIVDLFYEPAIGLVTSPGEFARGVGRGVKSLARKTVYGVTSTVKSATAAVANAAAAATFDEEWQRERRRMMRRRPKHVGEGLVMAAGHLGRGLRDGVTGVFLKPIEGARKEGVKGFFKGVAKGLIGLVTKPIVGAFDMVSAGADAVRQSLTDENGRIRVRPPRPLTSGPIRQYNFQEARVYEFLLETNSSKYGDDNMYWYLTHGDSTYVVTNHRVVCLQGVSERFRWSAAYHAIAMVKEQLLDAQGQPIHVDTNAHADPFAGHDQEMADLDLQAPVHSAVALVICIARWIPLPFSEYNQVTVTLPSISDANAMLYHMKQQHPGLDLRLKYTSPMRSKDDLLMMVSDSSSRAGDSAQEKLTMLQERALVTRETATRRDEAMKEQRKCCASCCCVM
jgi:hypothetical protein